VAGEAAGTAGTSGPGRSGEAAGQVRLLVGGDDVEREDEAARVVGAADRVADVDVEHALVGAGADVDLVDLDARFPAVEAGVHLVLDAARGLLVDRGEDQVVDGAAELRAHRALAGRGGEDQPDGLLDLALAADQGDAAGGRDAHGERPAGADELFGHQWATCLRFPVRAVGPAGRHGGRRPVMRGAGTSRC
jgi:hypothetical protein